MLGGMKTLPELKQKFRHLWPHLNERGKRMVAAEEALQIGFGGISFVTLVSSGNTLPCLPGSP